MKIIITEEQLKKVTESIIDGTVKCDKCGWGWDLKDDGLIERMCWKKKTKRSILLPLPLNKPFFYLFQSWNCTAAGAGAG